ncbi:uncharacterized protein J3D65DRAFT_666469 [Phyllosticta citribraziliensis]|uniref:BTB domain-containing protein n=1 Tax=Phyllosticta citribraziliensis TaxID=989973 RepID=A0ABR1LX58_9PEZI
MDDTDVKVFDPDGDIRLVVYDRSADAPIKKTFVVESKIMSRASDAWKAMLTGGFMESRPEPGREVELPEDDPLALEVLLNIAHMRYHLVPEVLDFPVLVQVTVLTDKYGATGLLRPWYKLWLASVEKHLLDPGYEEWLWIA